MIRTPALVVTLVLAVLLAMFVTRTPPVLDAKAPATIFSADRAQLDVAQVAKVPHAVGSEANAKVRDYLVARLQGMGFQPAVRPGSGLFQLEKFKGMLIGGQVENIITILPGRDHSLPKLGLMAHYDSVVGSPGAGDDAAGVATVLEVARAIQARGVPERDVMLILTDGEEAGLLGASAFFREDPQARSLGMILNMEARGGGGRTMMFQTGADNGPLIDSYAEHATRPASNSLGVFMYKNMPNDTDLTVALDYGYTGLNFGFIGREFDYHAPRAAPATLERAALQHMGDQVLPQAMAFAFSKTLPAKGPDAVYSDVFGAFVIAYPPVVGWLVLLVAVGLIGFAAARFRSQDGLDWRDLGAGAAASVTLLVVGVPVARLIRAIAGKPGWIEQRNVLAQFPLYELTLALAGLGLTLAIVGLLVRGRARLWGAAAGLLIAAAAWAASGNPIMGAVGAAAAVVSVAAFFGPRRPNAAFVGFLIPLALSALAAQILAPTIGFFFAWPLLVAALAAVAVALLGSSVERPTGLVVTAALAIVGLGWVLDQGHGLALGLGSLLPEPLTLIAWLAAALLFPLVAHARARVTAGAALLVLVAALTAFMALRNPYSARFPQTGQVQYLADLDNGRFLRAAPLTQLDSWSRSVLVADGGKIEKVDYPAAWQTPAFAAAAKPAVFAQPRVEIERLTDGRERLTVELAGTSQVKIRLRFPKGSSEVRFAGIPVKGFDQPNHWNIASWSAPKGPLEITYRAPVSPDVQYAFNLESWPAGVNPPAKPPVTINPWGASGTTLLVGSKVTRR
jgi:hypothetical protein